MENEPILLLTHNGWGLELVKSVQMIVGEVTNVHEVALQAEDSLGDYLERVTEKIDQLTTSSSRQLSNFRNSKIRKYR